MDAIVRVRLGQTNRLYRPVFGPIVNMQRIMPIAMDA